MCQRGLAREGFDRLNAYSQVRAAGMHALHERQDSASGCRMRQQSGCCCDAPPPNSTAAVPQSAPYCALLTQWLLPPPHVCTLPQVYISCGGRPLSPRATLEKAGVEALCTLHIHPKCAASMRQSRIHQALALESCAAAPSKLMLHIPTPPNPDPPSPRHPTQCGSHLRAPEPAGAGARPAPPAAAAPRISG